MSNQIRPAKLADTIAERLELLILEGALRPDERLLPERELALRFDVSRPSLREALEKLEEKGLLYAGRGGASHVAPLLGEGFIGPLTEVFRDAPESTFDYLEFRSIIEGSAVYLAALRATDIDRGLIRTAFERIEAAHGEDDPTNEADADAEFHLSLYEASHNLLLLHIMRALSQMLRHDVFYNRAKLFQRKGVRDLLLEQHRAIYLAVMAGDPDAARKAAQQHISFTREALHEITQSDARLESQLRQFARQEFK
ncbi:MAG TPA: FCD domain-containing protein [Candidatus Sulfotelmatobacter sp.]|jgi:GntR family transcriptional repressor for pyruvate dehydrogenase complex|nr:FCD domain-containing protein [Candidatus Sulfotelmatobacter sp.]